MSSMAVYFGISVLLLKWFNWNVWFYWVFCLFWQCTVFFQDSEFSGQRSFYLLIFKNISCFNSSSSYASFIKFPVGSDGTGSRSINLHYSGTASNEVQNFAGNSENVDELLKASPSLETLHKLNATLQKRFEEKVVQLERILQTNLARQVSKCYFISF